MTSRPPTPEDRGAVLDRLTATMVAQLGFDVAAIALSRPDGRLEVASVVGDEVLRTALLGSVETAESFGALLPGNALLVPLIASDGTHLGALSGVGAEGEDLRETVRPQAMEAFAVAAGLVVEQATLRARAEASQASLLSQAMSDPLTRVGTRTLLLERLRHASTARPDSNAAMALVFVDLDHFKTINDDHTHEVGDRVLRTVAERIQTAVRAHDTVARWGGDEFLVLLHPLADEHSALGAVQRVLSTIAEPIVDGSLTLNVTASVGVSFWSSQTPIEPEEMVRRADAAMYDAKGRGGDCLAVFDALDPESSRRLHLHGVLSRALDDDRVVVQYQPVVRLSDQRIVGVEALLRLRDDDDTLVYPMELLQRGAPPGDVAREVMRRACADLASWGEQGHDLWVSVNVSAQQVADIRGFVSDVREALVASGLSPERLTLELTEHTLLTTTPRMLAGIQELVDAGVRFSIDDFGTGYGSMTYLRVMPVHELKIDRSFVADALSQHAAGAIVRSIASLARDLGIRCVAEGVENRAHHELVQDAGVPLAQGRHYSDSLDANVLRGVLEQERIRAGTTRPV